ncbi:MAG: LytTR family DNA-binding domain-containing protein [Bacteroidota bacterium]
MYKISLNTSLAFHLSIALFISFWLVAFLTLIGPFDAASLSLKIRLILMPGYGAAFLFSYLLIIPLQNWLYQKVGKWHLGLESGMLLSLYLICLVPTYLYYISDHVNGDYDFLKFLGEVYLPSLLIISTLLIPLRLYGGNKSEGTSEKLKLKGESKKDVLQIEARQLVGISSAQNYVEVYYLHQKEIQKKLLRTSLKKIHQQAPDLIQVHRSHLINPAYFVGWASTNSIYLLDREIPVSKSYRPALLEYL